MPAYGIVALDVELWNFLKTRYLRDALRVEKVGSCSVTFQLILVFQTTVNLRKCSVLGASLSYVFFSFPFSPFWSCIFVLLFNRI